MTLKCNKKICIITSTSKLKCTIINRISYEKNSAVKLFSCIGLEISCTYVTIFLSRKYWSFFEPITRRNTTSSFSIYIRRRNGILINANTCTYKQSFTDLYTQHIHIIKCKCYNGFYYIQQKITHRIMQTSIRGFFPLKIKTDSCIFLHNNTFDVILN